MKTNNLKWRECSQFMMKLYKTGKYENDEFDASDENNEHVWNTQSVENDKNAQTNDKSENDEHEKND